MLVEGGNYKFSIMQYYAVPCHVIYSPHHRCQRPCRSLRTQSPRFSIALKIRILYF
jgi:hypothetical protein